MIVCPECKQETILRIERHELEPVYCIEDDGLPTFLYITEISCRSCGKIWASSNFPIELCKELTQKVKEGAV